MKKSGDSLYVGQVESEKTGVLLSTSLNKLHNEECVSLEEIAAIVDGNIDNGEKDRIMGHLASCDRCYQVFLLTSDLKEDNIIPMKKAFFSHPIRLAASIIVAVFSLFLVYKIIIVPGLPGKVESKPEAVREAPTLMLKEGYEVEKRDKRAEKREQETEEEVSRLMEKRIEKSAGEEPAPKGYSSQKKSSHEKKIFSKKSKAEEREPGKAAAVEVREKKAAKMNVKARQEQLDQDAGRQKVEQEQLQNLPRARNVQTGLDTAQQDVQLTQDQKNQTRKQQQVEQQQMAQQLQYAQDQKDDPKQKPAIPEKVALTDKKSPGKKPVVGAIQKGKGVPAPGVDTRAAAQRLNWELSKHSAYIPAEEIGSFFESAIHLARRFQSGLSNQFGHKLERDESGVQSMSLKELAPAMKTGTGEESGLILPDIDYFYKKSEPGTRENKFFKLALSGYCDAGSCFGLLKGKIEKSERDKLLKSWQELKPELTGIFSAIARHTINRLSQ